MNILGHSISFGIWLGRGDGLGYIDGLHEA